MHHKNYTDSPKGTVLEWTIPFIVISANESKFLVILEASKINFWLSLNNEDGKF